MPQGEQNETTPTSTTEIKWFGNEVLFHLGARPVKIWELIVGLIILSMIMPLFYGRRNGYRNGSRR
tara:strand:- start:5590 stop:5787 length:198 start_codon:yes stop_codon:yes gene_type:complete